MVKCAQCGKEINGSAASISGGIMGDEYIDTYFFCDDCRVYTKEYVRDRFLGEETSATSGPFTKTEGDAKVKLIKKCKEPWNKKCRCKAHMEYFGPNLD